jgi:hypothetical protein
VSSSGAGEAILAADFFETVTLTGARMHVLAVIEHASRRPPHPNPGYRCKPTAGWVRQAVRNLAMDLSDAGCRARFLIRDRDPREHRRVRPGAHRRWRRDPQDPSASAPGERGNAESHPPALVTDLGEVLAEVDVEGSTAYVRAADLDELAEAAPTRAVRLVPAFDQHVLGPGTGDPHVVPMQRRGEVSKAAGWIAPVVIAGGRAAGTWRVVGGRVAIHLFPESDRAAGGRPGWRGRTDHTVDLSSRNIDGRRVMDSRLS